MATVVGVVGDVQVLLGVPVMPLIWTDGFFQLLGFNQLRSDRVSTFEIKIYVSLPGQQLPEGSVQYETTLQYSTNL